MSAPDRKDCTSEDNHPPRLAECVLGMLLPDDDWDTPKGDFEEVFHQVASERGLLSARWWYRGQVVMLIPDRLFARTYWGFAMLKNYLQIALRNLRRHTGYSFINIAGLAVGMSAFLLIGLFVRDQLSFDRFHDNADQIYRITRTTVDDEGQEKLRSLQPYNLGTLLTSDYPEVVRAVRFMTESSVVVRRPDNNDEEYYETATLLTESSIFDVFSFDVLQGHPDKLLERPDAAVLTRSAARLYFGQENPVGKTLQFDNEFEVEVTGVVADPPATSSIQFNILVPLDAPFGRRTRLKRFISSDWRPSVYVTYVQMLPEADVSGLAAELPAHLSSAVSEDLTNLLQMSNEEATAFKFEPMTDTYLFSQATNRLGNRGNLQYLYIFGTVALLILLVAAVNYMNLATARSVRRAREVGMRKVFGAYRRQISGQFLGEALLLTVLALPISVLLVEAVLPAFNQLVQSEIDILYLHDWQLIVGLFAFTIVLGTLAGSYPALYLSRFRPMVALRDTFTPSGSAFRLRQVLVIFQFAISTGLIISTVLIQRQLDFVRTSDLGLDEDNMLVLSLYGTPASSSASALKQKVLDLPYVESAALSTGVPSRRAGGTASFGRVESDIEIDGFSVDDDFLDTYGIRLKNGRGFRESFARSEKYLPVLVNETGAQAVRALGRGPALGNRLTISTSDVEIIGIVEDFHATSFHELIEPIKLTPAPEDLNRMGYLSIKLGTDDVASVLSDIDRVWESAAPDHPLNYFFLDEQYDQMYRTEDRLGHIFQAFTGIVILIACLGLFGLAAFAAEQRTREIGIRKVLGATSSAIVLLLSKDFLKLVLVGVILITPVAWFSISRWMASFAYRTTVPVWIFVASGLGALFVALATVSYQSLRAATTDPAKALRHE